MTIEKAFKAFLLKAQNYLPDEDITLLRSGYDYSAKAHEGQLRQSKKPYISHPIEVASILCDLEQSAETLLAGLLHDTVEDTPVTLDDIQALFGDRVKILVDGVTKLNKLEFTSKEEAQAENYRRMFLAMADDYRVIIIKLADRLHNCRTLQFLSPKKQKQVAQETLDIFAPLAHRLGIGSIRWELEDLSFRYLFPEKFHEIKDLLEISRKDRETIIEDSIKDIKMALKKASINTEISGRPKHIFSIYKKLHSKKTSIDNIYDLLGIRIIVDDISQCYASLGIIHAKYKPISERFKDYIALPKPNGYQSLHTSVVGPKGKLIEIQIRTQEMAHTAAFGLAAHWHYKEGSKRQKVEGELKWLKNIIDHQKESLAPLDFLQTLKLDLYIDEVFVFTPNGDVKVLSQGSTALDFAYSIHTEIGHKCKGALVNGAITPLNVELKNGDIVEILTGKDVTPKVDWLQMVSSRHSRYKIKQWLNRQNKSTLIGDGKQRLKKACFIQGIPLEESIKKIGINTIKDRFHLSKLDDLYLYVEQGDVSPKEIIRYLTTQLKTEEEPQLKLKKTKKNPESDSGGLYVLGEKNMKFTLAKCCSPIPGDDVSGIVVMGKGISIHRSDCTNLVAVKDKEPGRLLDVNWDESDNQNRKYHCTIKIEGYDREGLLKDLLSIIYLMKIDLREVTTKVNKDNTRMSALFSVDLKNIKQFYEIKRQLSSIPDVYCVSRVSLGLEQ